MSVCTQNEYMDFREVIKCCGEIQTKMKERKIVARREEIISHLFNKLVIIKINESDKNVDGDANAGLCEILSLHIFTAMLSVEYPRTFLCVWVSEINFSPSYMLSQIYRQM
jgi:hypothetical protein